MTKSRVEEGEIGAMAVADALRQAFMSPEDYEGLRFEERVWARLQKPLCMVSVTAVWTAVVVSMMIMVDVVFAVSGDDFPFCQKRRLPAYGVAGRADLPPYVYTEEEAVDAFWLVVFLPSSVVFVFSTIYLFAGAHPGTLNPEPCDVRLFCCIAILTK